MFLHADSEDSDQTVRMPRLIWVHAGCTGHFVGFVMRRLIFEVKPKIRDVFKGLHLPYINDKPPDIGIPKPHPIQCSEDKFTLAKNFLSDLAGL